MKKCEHGNRSRSECRRCTLHDKISTLLDNWRFFFEPREAGLAVSGDGPSGIALISSMSRHPSVLELERCLAVLKKHGPRHYKHLSGYYNSEWRTVREPKKKLVRGRVVVLSADPDRDEDWDYRRERIVPSWIEMRLVELGVDFVAGSWSLPNGADIPKPLMSQLHTIGDVTTEAA